MYFCVFAYMQNKNAYGPVIFSLYRVPVHISVLSNHRNQSELIWSLLSGDSYLLYQNILPYLLQASLVRSLAAHGLDPCLCAPTFFLLVTMLCATINIEDNSEGNFYGRRFIQKIASKNACAQPIGVCQNLLNITRR